MTPHLSKSTAAGGFVFLSGQLAMGDDGALVGETVADQTKRVLENIERVLNSVGMGLFQVVKTTVWITRAEDFAAFNAAYAEVFGAHKPARSTVVAQLAISGALVEIEAVAYRGSD